MELRGRVCVVAWRRETDVSVGGPEAVIDEYGSPNDTVRRSVSVVIVAFNSSGPLNELLRRLKRSLAEGDVEDVIVVNNSQDDEAQIAAVATESHAEFVQNKRNLGYGAACNVGAKLARGDYILFLNPDVYLSPGSISALVNTASRLPQGVAFGPELFDDGRLRKRKRVSNADPARVPRQSFPKSSGIKSTGFLSGCALLVRREAFEKVAGFDENIFLYHEDDDLCIRLRGLGFLYKVETAAALHSHGYSSSDPSAWKPMRARALGYSLFYLMRKHRGRYGLFMAVLRMGLRCVSPLNLLSARYRNKTICMVKGAAMQVRGKDCSSVIPSGVSP